MTNDTRKPREFWINWHSLPNEGYAQEKLEPNEDPMHFIHVIEYNAYEAMIELAAENDEDAGKAQAEAADLRKERDEYRAALEGLTLEPVHDFNLAIEVLAKYPKEMPIKSEE